MENMSFIAADEEFQFDGSPYMFEPEYTDEELQDMESRQREEQLEEANPMARTRMDDEMLGNRLATSFPEKGQKWPEFSFKVFTESPPEMLTLQTLQIRCCLRCAFPYRRIFLRHNIIDTLAVLPDKGFKVNYQISPNTLISTDINTDKTADCCFVD